MGVDVTPVEEPGCTGEPIEGCCGFAAEPVAFDGDAAGGGREVDGGVIVFGDEDKGGLVGGSEWVADGGGVMQAATGCAVVGVEVGEVDERRVAWE